MKNKAATVPQVAQWSLQPPEICSSNPAVSHFHSKLIYVCVLPFLIENKIGNMWIKNRERMVKGSNGEHLNSVHSLKKIVV